MPDKRRVLVVEDDANIRELIRTRLHMQGYEVHVARNGREALERIANIRPGGVVLDINMPELDGFGVLEAMKSGLNGKRVPVLVLTARNGADDVRRAVSLGAKDYLAKPFSEAQLTARVARLFRPPAPRPPATVQVLSLE
jgi:DNA-binding response OmpR family regulator